MFIFRTLKTQVGALALLECLTPLLSGCEKALPREDSVVCYSGGTIVYDAKAAGEVDVNAGVFSFVDAETKGFVRITGDCVAERYYAE